MNDGAIQLYRKDNDIILAANHEGMRALKAAMDESRNKGASKLFNQQNSSLLHLAEPGGDNFTLTIIDSSHLARTAGKTSAPESYEDAYEHAKTFMASISVADMEGVTLSYWTALAINAVPKIENGRCYTLNSEGEVAEDFDPLSNPELCEKLEEAEGVVVHQTKRWIADHPKIEFLTPFYSRDSRAEAVCRSIVASRFGIYIRFPDNPEKSREVAEREFEEFGIDG